ncbi:hypothetical protein FQN54_007782 [Arachnomyces sp. PD_36]|nr:hypothetical protein FQN54_007782 [Arachnomyces sp. PD_36]
MAMRVCPMAFSIDFILLITTTNSLRIDRFPSVWESSGCVYIDTEFTDDRTALLTTAYLNTPGVFFRDFTRKRASEHDVTGWVRNTVNGDVEGEAQGQEESVQKFLQDLGKGPPRATVEKVEKSTIDALEGESRFDIVR